MSFLRRIGTGLRSVRSDLRAAAQLNAGIAVSNILAAKILIDRIAARGVLEDIRDAEFKVFSQFGEDGIIQYLIRAARVPADQLAFIEFGVQTYQEANTRFLLANNNWRGLVIDQDEAGIKAIRQSDLCWRHDLTAVTAFIDADNINGVIQSAGVAGPIGLLSIDVDGNDYWIWEKINVVDPIIVIVEYNSIFGPTHAITVPYDPHFSRWSSHYSGLYFGCSLKALELLANRKGYQLVGSESAGNNAFFVKNEYLNALPAKTARQAYVESRFRESHDERGKLSYLSGRDRLRAIKDMIVFDIVQEKSVRISDLFSL